MRVVCRCFFVLVATAGIAACSPGALDERPNAPSSAADAIRNADLSPRFPTPARSTDAATPGFHGFEIFGSSSPPQPDRAQQAASDDPEGLSAGSDGYTLNFDNAPIAAVAKAVLGDALSLSYVVDPRAQGAITVSTARPIARKDLLTVLEGSLRANGLSMVREGGGYHIGPTGETTSGPVDRDGAAEAGYGTSVIPLRYVSSATISHLLEGFATKPGAIRADASGSMLIIVGGSAERQSAIDTVRSFDVDWMRGQSVGLYPVHNSEPEPLVAAIEKIMDSGEGGLGHGLVKLQPIARKNAILVVSAKPDLLRTAARWIERLDSPDSNSLSVHVYKLRYGDSKQVAQLLNAMFVSGGGSSADANSNTLAPGSGETSLSAAERLTGGKSTALTPTPSESPSATGGQNSQSGQSAQGAGSSPFGSLTTSSPASASTSGGQGGGGTALPGVRIAADPSSNSVVIYANSDNYATVERALIQLDRPKAQVAIDVTIAEVTLNDSLSYGVQFYLRNQLGGVINSSTGQPVAAANAPEGFNVLVGSGTTPRAIINALHSVTDVRILSNPSLVVLDNQEASLEVGQQVPVSTGSATVLTTSNTVVNTVDYKNTGIILQVLPHISPDNVVRLDINQEISSVPTDSTTNLTPTISERKVKSAVSVVSGQMVVLAGLVADQQSKSRSGVPGLSQLPVIGGAFGTTGNQTERTELIILIRPQVIRDGADASQVAEQLRAKMRSGRTPAFSLPDALNVNARPLQP